jgi:NAD(P)-dependent dehydrogenase (short-subunit alcohol dehydrogenase family)
MQATHLEGKTIIVTGASSGIGLGLARTLVARGANVVATSRSIEGSGALSRSERLLTVGGDVARPETAARVLQAAIERFGRVDGLVNNAGIFVARAFVETTDEEVERLIDTNLRGFVSFTRAVVKRLLAQGGGGAVVNITTSLAEQPIAGVNAAASILIKGGLEAATRALAIELAPNGVRVNAVAPGIIDTPMHPPENHAFLRALHPIARLGTVSEIADAVLYLLTADFVTGEVLHVDGGAHAGRW